MKKLSPREVEAVTYTMQGMDANKVGKAMKCSPRTARFHLDNAKEKMGAKNLPHLVAKFLMNQNVEGQTNGDDPTGEGQAGADVGRSRSDDPNHDPGRG